MLFALNARVSVQFVTDVEYAMICDAMRCDASQMRRQVHPMPLSFLCHASDRATWKSYC